MILARSKTFVEKQILKNCVQNRMLYSRLNDYIWENIQEQSRYSPNDDIAELKGNLQMTL